MSRTHNIGKLLVASGALCLAAGCGDADAPETKNKPGVSENVEQAAAATGDAAEEVGEAVIAGADEAAATVGSVLGEELDQANALGLTARNLIGENVRTPDGAIAGRVHDLLFNDAGEPVLAVLSEGGLFGVGEDDVVVSIERLTIVEDSRGELNVGVSLSDTEIEQLGDGVGFLPADFSVGGAVETSLLSARKILDAAVYNGDGMKVADVFDILLARDWGIENYVVSIGGAAGLGDQLFLASRHMLEMSPQQSTLSTTPTAVDFGTLPPFDYELLLEERR